MRQFLGMIYIAAIGCFIDLNYFIEFIYGFEFSSRRHYSASLIGLKANGAQMHKIIEILYFFSYELTNESEIHFTAQYKYCGFQFKSNMKTVATTSSYRCFQSNLASRFLRGEGPS